MRALKNPLRGKNRALIPSLPSKDQGQDPSLQALTHSWALRPEKYGAEVVAPVAGWGGVVAAVSKTLRVPSLYRTHCGSFIHIPEPYEP